MRDTHLFCQAWGWLISLNHFIQVGYYHAAYDFVPDGRLDVCDLQHVINLMLSAWRY